MDRNTQAKRSAGIADYKSWPSRSTSKLLAVALMLNRHDVLANLGYTMLQAVERLDQGWFQNVIGIQAELIHEGVVHLDQSRPGA